MKKIVCIILVFAFSNSKGQGNLPIIKGQIPIRDSVIILNKQKDNMSDEIQMEKLKEVWMEKAHHAAPGIVWQNIESDNQIKSYQNILTQKNKFYKSGTYANGQLVGSWAERGSKNQAGRCVAVDYSKSDNKLYTISNDGSLYKGIPDSASWHPSNEQLSFNNKILKIVKNSNGGKRILTAVGLTIFYSDDDGNTFNPSTGITFPISWGGNYIHELASLTDSTTLYLITRPWDGVPWATRYWLYSSTDHGQSWQKIYTFPFGGDDNRLHLWKPEGLSNVVYALFNQNSGDTSTLFSITGNSNVQVVNTSRSLPTNTDLLFSGNVTSTTTTLYAVTGGNNLYQSTNLGISWTSIGTLPTSTGVLEVSPNDANKLFVGGVNAYRSFDGGANWTLINDWGSYYSSPATNLHADIFNIRYFKKSNGTSFIIINCDGGCYRSDDDMQTVTNIGLKDLNVSEYYSIISDSKSNLFIGSQDQGLQRASNVTANTNVLSFDQVISGDYGKLELTRNEQTLWAEYPGGHLYYYYDALGGYTTDWSLPGTTKPVSGWMLATAPVYPSKNNQIYLAGGNLTGGSGSYLIKLTGTSNTITATQGTYDFRGTGTNGISALATTPIDTNRIYAAKEDGSFYSSNNAGTTWTKTTSFTGPTPQYLFGNCIYASKKNANLVLLGGSGYSNPGIYLSKNGGSLFSSLAKGLPSTLVFGITADENEKFFFAATEAGPYVLSFADSIWYPLGGGIAPAKAYWAVDFDTIHHIVHFATFGRGVWDFYVESGTNALTLSVDTIRSPYNGNSTNVNVNTNLSWTASSNQTWATVNPISGTSNGSFTVTTSANVANQRNATITVNAGSNVKTIYVIQSQKTSGINTLSYEKQFKIYPDPASNELHIESTVFEKQTLQLFDITGKLILSNISFLQNTSINLSEFKKGIYVLQISNGEGVMNKKIVVE